MNAAAAEGVWFIHQMRTRNKEEARGSGAETQEAYLAAMQKLKRFGYVQRNLGTPLVPSLETTFGRFAAAELKLKLHASRRPVQQHQ